ncbi:FabD/lysophospholipase-like protein [Copromyces sp. CBS 386.78]|nr:FabD/lysophospholipase-like protein [Copromyces sp. CBS 386.78]
MSSDDDVVNILSLDGGVVRALSEVIMLDRIMKRIQEKQGLAEIPKPCDYFHLIGGIGTGGIAAILFGRLRMTTTEALAGYENIASEIFSTAKRRLEFNIAFREEKVHVEQGMKNVMKGRKDGH